MDEGGNVMYPVLRAGGGVAGDGGYMNFFLNNRLSYIFIFHTFLHMYYTSQFHK